MPGHETTFLIDTVGDALAKGVAATVAAQPSDPVEYLAEWLLRHVESEQLQASYLKDKKQHIDQEKRRVAQALEEENAKRAAAEARKAAVNGLAAMAADPVSAWQKAVQLVKMYTSAASVYVANIVDEEQPSWTPPEDPEADVETDDEAEHAAAAAAGDETAADSAEAAPADAEQEQPQDPAEDDPTADSTPAVPDYSQKLLRYVAASTGQEFMTKLELRRPKAAEDESVEGQQPEPTPITFKILDEHIPLLEVPTVATEPRVKFLRKFPRIGGYCAAAVPAGSAGPAAGCYQAVLAVDTLLPEGHGQALNQEEVTFIWDVAQALGSALDAAATARKTDAARGGAADVLARLAAAVADIRKSAEQPAAAAEAIEDPADPEGEEENTEQLSAADQIAGVEADLQHSQQKLAAAKATAASAAAALELEQKVLDAIVKAITGVRGVAIGALKLFSSSPPATLHVLRAVLLLLGRDSASFSTWREAVQHVHGGIFEDIAAYDATQDRNMELWKKVRAAYKAVQKPQDLEKELPQCGLGLLLLQWIKQVRLVSRKAAAVREAEKAVAVSEETIANKEQQLSEAKEAKAKADEAEAEAATAAAAEEAETAAAEDNEEAEEAGEEEQ